MCVKVPGRDKQSPQVLHRADDDAVSYRGPRGVLRRDCYPERVEVYPKVFSEPRDEDLCDAHDLFYQPAEVSLFLCFFRR